MSTKPSGWGTARLREPRE